MSADPRRQVPRTDTLLADPQLAAAGERLGRALVKDVVQRVQQRIRDGELSAPDAVDAVLAELPARAGSLRPVLNATGVLVHTNLGRSPLSPAAVEAVVAASGTTDVELDLATGRRGPRGEGALAALRDAVPAAEAALVVNNCAAALALVATALGQGRELVLARGELVEIGDGFRIPELLGATGARLREVGTTNRVTLADYRGALGPDTGAVLKVHPSNFVVRGFTRAVSVAELAVALAGSGIPLVADVGSGLLRPHPLLPEEPDLQSTLSAGADLVLASGDKLLGGPQAGLVLGREDLVQRLRRHPLYRALRVDKTTLAALEATLRGPTPPVQQMLTADLGVLRARARDLAARLTAAGVPAEPVDAGARVGGGGAPEHPLPSAAVALAATFADALRRGTPPVVAYLDGGRTLLNLRSVPATAGHVDHGKSALVRALTGMEPDRWAEERRRGLTIDLGFAWTTLPSGRRLAVVDVPGHERFVGNMLAGVGSVPAALLVVAANDGWSRQTAEHVAVLDALGVRHALLAVTKADLADPRPVLADVRERLAATSMGDVPGVAVSARTGAGLPELTAALEGLLAGLPTPDPSGPVRLWVDRAFTIRGAGTVVTGTLASGTVAEGDRLRLGDHELAVRGVQSLGAAVPRAAATARVALNLRGVAVEEISRGDALLTPGAFRATTLVDVTLAGAPEGRLPTEPMVHVGSATVAARLRPLDGAVVRLRLAAALPLRIGDRLLVRDPGSRTVFGADVRDVEPPELRRRGAARQRAAALSAQPSGPAGAAADLARRRIVRADEFAAMGWPVPADAVHRAPWLLAAGVAEELAARVPDVVRRYRTLRPLEPGPPVEVVRRALELPDPELVDRLVHAPLALREGRVVEAAADLPAAVQRAVDAIVARLAADPFAAPEAGDLAAAGLGARELAAAVRSGQLVRIAEGIYLAPGIGERARGALAVLPQPFTLSQARQVWGTSRRVAVPLMEWLDAQGVTVRLPDNTRRLR